MTDPYGIDGQFPTVTCFAEIFVKLKSEMPLVAWPRRVDLALFDGVVDQKLAEAFKLFGTRPLARSSNRVGER
jgi:hypothetical protein